MSSSPSIDQKLTWEFKPADFSVVKDRPHRRDLTCVNVERDPKDRFERVIPIYEARLGRRLTQWEAFAIMVAEIEEKYAYELAAMRGR